MFWIRIHMYRLRKAHWQTTILGHSTLEIELRCPGECSRQWRWMVKWIEKGGVLGVCFSSLLKNPGVSRPAGVKNSSIPLEESLHKVTSLPWAWKHESVRAFSPLFLFLSRCLPLFSPLWLNGLPRPLNQQGLCNKGWVCVLTNPQAN